MAYLPSYRWFVDHKGEIEITVGRGAEPIWLTRGMLEEMLGALTREDEDE